jgi:hypothetical protein
LSELPTDEPVSVSYDADSETYLARFDSDVLAPSMAVVEAMASVHDTTPTELEPLVETVDPTAVDRLVKSDDEATDRALEFQYLDHVVTVRSRGVVEICPPSDDEDD